MKIFLSLNQTKSRIDACLQCEYFDKTNKSCSLCGCPCDDIWTNYLVKCPDERFEKNESDCIEHTQSEVYQLIKETKELIEKAST